MSALKSDIFHDETFVFTPKGDVIALPHGATVIDFAYAIHSAVGNKMIGAKINGMIVPIDRVPQNGEIVEILTSSASKGPSRDWLKIVQTSEAKTKIRQWFKKEKRADNIVVGQSAVESELRRYNTPYTEAQRNEIVENVGKRIGFNTADDVYNTIGYGGLPMSKIALKLHDEFERLIKPAPEVPVITDVEQVQLAKAPKASKGSGVIVDGEAGCLVKFAKCCNPLPGDNIVGFITKGYGISVHKRDCPNAVAGLNNPESADRWIDAMWEYRAEQNTSDIYEATIVITAYDSIMLIADITAALADMRVALLQINSQKKGENSVLINLKVGCKNIDHFNSIVSKLRSLRDVDEVKRGFS